QRARGFGVDQLQTPLRSQLPATIVRCHAPCDPVEPTSKRRTTIVVSEPTMDDQEHVVHDVIEMFVGNTQPPQSPSHEAHVVPVHLRQRRGSPCAMVASSQNQHLHNVRSWCCPLNA